MTSAPSKRCNGTFPWRHPDDRAEIAGGAGGNRADHCCMTSPQSAGRARSTGPASPARPTETVPAYRRIFASQAAGAFPIPPRGRRRHHDDAARPHAHQGCRVTLEKRSHVGYPQAHWRHPCRSKPPERLWETRWRATALFLGQGSGDPRRAPAGALRVSRTYALP